MQDLEDVTEVEGLDAYLTIKDVNGGVDYVYSQEAVKSYGWIFKTVKWDDVHVADNLLKKGKGISVRYSVCTDYIDSICC